jgi:hypothetical protein
MYSKRESQKDTSVEDEGKNSHFIYFEEKYLETK